MPNASAQNDAHAHSHVPPGHQAAVGRQLKRQQGPGGQGNKMSAGQAVKDTMQLAQAASSPAGAAKVAAQLVKKIAKQIDPVTDWPFFFLLLPFAALKDIFDWLFSFIPPVGIAVSFVGAILIACLTIVVFLLLGAGFRGLSIRKQSQRIAARILVVSGGCLAESIPGLNFSPIETLTALVAYIIVLLERAQDTGEIPAVVPI